jgi:hypothetical protein
MKKLVLTTVCALAMTGAAFAQGFANWGSAPFGSITAQTNTASSPLLYGGPGTGGVVGNTAGAATSTFLYELLYTTYTGDGTTLPSIPSLTSLLQWQDAGLSATNSNTAGRLTVVNPNSAATVPWAAGVTDSIALVGWSANLGFTWGTVSNILRQVSLGNYNPLNAALGGSQGFFGISTTGFIAAGSSSITGATVFNNAPVLGTGTPIFSLNTPLFLVNPVPEPATMALMGLGGLSLLLFRRQRK